MMKVRGTGAYVDIPGLENWKKSDVATLRNHDWTVALDLGCGLNKPSGFIGMDIVKGVADIIHDMNDFPYPIDDNYADVIRMNHILEHVEKPLKTLEECYRIAKSGCLILINVPPWKKAGPDSNAWHLHAFRPRYFEYLCEMNHNAMNKSLKHNFRLKSMKWLRSRKRFWHVYELQVVLETVK